MVELLARIFRNKFFLKFPFPGQRIFNFRSIFESSSGMKTNNFLIFNSASELRTFPEFLSTKSCFLNFLSRWLQREQIPELLPPKDEDFSVLLDQ